MKLKYLLAPLLIFAVILPLFAGCAPGAGGDVQTTPPATQNGVSGETTAAAGDGLPEKTFGGKEFNILARAEVEYKGEFLAEEENGDTINDSVYRRNRNVEERFDIKIVPTLMNGYATYYDSFYNTVANSVKAGDDTFQLVGGYTYRLASASLDGSFVNWYKVPYINLDKPWWSNGFLDAAAIGDNAYIVTGDLSYMFLQYTFAMFFNKKLAADYNIPSLYETVKAGDWTIDKMAEYMKFATADLDGDGKPSKDDRFGLVIDRSTRIDAFLYAFEVPISAKDENGLPYIVGPTEKYQSVIEKLNALIHDSGDSYIDQDFDPNILQNKTHFYRDLALFSPMRLAEAISMRSMDSDFGIIPYPKWDKEQTDYHTYYSDNCTGFVIPVTVGDLDFTGLITEALAAESYRQVRPAVYEVALKTKHARDEESQEMIDMILDTMIFDFTNIYAFSFGDQKGPAHSLRMNVRSNSNDIASYFASSENLYNETMNRLIKAVTES